MAKDTVTFNSIKDYLCLKSEENFSLLHYNIFQFHQGLSDLEKNAEKDLGENFQFHQGLSYRQGGYR